MTSAVGLSSTHSPISQPSCSSCSPAEPSSSGKSRALAICHLPSCFTRTTVYRLCSVPSPDAFTIVVAPSSIATDGSTNRMTEPRRRYAVWDASGTSPRMFVGSPPVLGRRVPLRHQLAIGAKRAANALASWAFDALVKASTSSRIAFSSSARIARRRPPWRSPCRRKSRDQRGCHDCRCSHGIHLFVMGESNIGTIVSDGQNPCRTLSSRAPRPAATLYRRSILGCGTREEATRLRPRLTRNPKDAELSPSAATPATMRRGCIFEWQCIC